MSEKKPLETLEQQNSAYPQHAKLRALKEQELGAEKLCRYLYKTYFAQWLPELQTLGDFLDRVRPLVQEQDPELPPGDQVEEVEVDEGGTVLYNMLQVLRQFDPVSGDPRKTILEALEIDWAAFWREKDDMLEQFRMRQLTPTAVLMANAEEERQEESWRQTLRSALEQVFDGHPDDYPGEVAVTEKIEAVAFQERELDENDQTAAVTFEIQLSVRQTWPTGFSQEDHYPTLRVPIAGGELQLAGIDFQKELRPT